MLLYRELFRRLKAGFHALWSYRLCCILLVSLDISAVVGFVWYFFFRESVSVAPATLTILAVLYLIFVGALFFIAMAFGKLVSVRVATMFYLTVGLFFLVTGLYADMDQEFQLWPWVLLWITTLMILLFNFAREFTEGQDKTPQP